MSSHTDLIYVYELTKNALDNIKDLERKMKKIDRKKNTRINTRRKMRKMRKTRKTRRAKKNG